MASLSSPPSGPANPRSTEWGRSGERGSAFRGMTRGRGGVTGGGSARGDRGRGGRGGGRGSGGPRGGRTGGHSPGPDAGSKVPASLTPSVAPTSSAASTKSSVSARSSISTMSQPLPGTDHSTRPKPARRGSQQQAPRKVPSLNVEPASPMVDSFSGAQASAPRPVTRRRRSHQSSKSGIPSSLGETLSVEPAPALRPRKSHSGPSSPRAPSKDTPPHLAAVSAGPTTTTFSSKENIDSLVERVRAMAMEHNRPATPGSHIDWAGDDDDTLPDLDDWGVSTTTGTSVTSTDGGLSEPAAKLELMSPILDDSLKQLPPPFEKPKLFSVGSASPVAAIRDSNGSGDETPGGHGDKTLTEGAVQHVLAGLPPPAKMAKADALATPQQNHRINGRPKPVSADEAAKLSPRPPLHPSLPPKPIDVSPPSAITSHRTHPPLPKAAAESTVEQGLPSHTEHNNDDAHDEGKPGLSASIHAPKSSHSESALSSLVPGQPPHGAPTGFNPAHGRSRTLGRPPFSAGGAMAHRTFLSGASTPRSESAHHARTQSTPPATVGRHARHASRPVITGDAISRLARTLGSPPPKREAVSAAGSE